MGVCQPMILNVMLYPGYLCQDPKLLNLAFKKGECVGGVDMEP